MNAYITKPTNTMHIPSVSFEKVYIKPIEQKIPKGFHTSEEWAEIYHISHRTMQRKIKGLNKKGKIKIIMVNGLTILSNNWKYPYYKISR